MVNWLIVGLTLITACHDGDTLRTAQNQKIRLSEIDCPELKQPFGLEAQKFTASKVLNKKVKIVFKGSDFYKRTLGIVYIRNVELNKMLVEKGYAWSYNSKRLKPLELQAKAKKLGLWADPNPIEPRVFRKKPVLIITNEKARLL